MRVLPLPAFFLSQRKQRLREHRESLRLLEKNEVILSNTKRFSVIKKMLAVAAPSSESNND
jgi:hypothetical protein